MRAFTPVQDSGAGPNHINLRCVGAPWRSAIRPVRRPTLVDASNWSMRALGEITLYVRTGEFSTKANFLVVTSLAVDCILGTTFIDLHVKALLLPQRKVLFHHAPAVAFTRNTPSKSPRPPASQPRSEEKENISWLPFLKNTPSRKIRLLRGTTIPPMRQATVHVESPVAGLCFLQNHPRAAAKHLPLIA